MRIGDVAERTGLSVRTLRHYEFLGLINPVRSGSDQRIYGAKDLVRVQRILDLKSLGLSLSAIGAVLKGEPDSVHGLLTEHRDHLRRDYLAIKRALDLTEHLLTAGDSGTDISDLTALCDVIRLGERKMTEEQWQKVYDRYYTKEEQERWLNAKMAIPEDVQRSMEARWPSLIARVESLLDAGASPASDDAQAALEEWNALLQPLFDHDPALLDGAGKLYADMSDWPEGAPEPPFSQAVYDFIAKAAYARNQGLN